MAIDPIEDIGFNPTATHMPQVEQTIPAMALTHRLGQSMPLQSLLAGVKLRALVHVMRARELPLPQLHKEPLQFPWIDNEIGYVLHTEAKEAASNIKAAMADSTS